MNIILLLYLHWLYYKWVFLRLMLYKHIYQVKEMVEVESEWHTVITMGANGFTLILSFGFSSIGNFELLSFGCSTRIAGYSMLCILNFICHCKKPKLSICTISKIHTLCNLRSLTQQYANFEICWGHNFFLFNFVF